MNVKVPLLLLLCISSALSLRAQADPRRAGGKETYEWLHQYFSDEEILRDFYYFGIRDHEDDDVEYDYTAGTNSEQLSRLFAPSAPMIGYARQARTLFEPSLRHEAPRGTLTVEAWNGGKMTVPYKTVNGRTIVDGICRYTCTRAQLPEATGSHYEQETYSVSMTLHVKQGKAVGLGISGKRQLWKPDPRAGLIMHSDQGWHYQHGLYQKLLGSRGIIQSMSRKGNCLDNSMMENFFAIMKNEMLYTAKYDSVEDFEQELRKYIWWYNNKRIKLRLKGMSPVQYRAHNREL